MTRERDTVGLLGDLGERSSVVSSLPQYRATALPAFKYYVTCACLIFFCIFIVQILVLPK